MTVNDLAPFVAVSVALLGGLIWIIKAQIAMTKQFTPNGGSSLRDSIDRLERTLTETRADVKELRAKDDEQSERLISSIGRVHARLDEHMRDHLGGK